MLVAAMLVASPKVTATVLPLNADAALLVVTPVLIKIVHKVFFTNTALPACRSNVASDAPVLGCRLVRRKLTL